MKIRVVLSAAVAALFVACAAPGPTSGRAASPAPVWSEAPWYAQYVIWTEARRIRDVAGEEGGEGDWGKVLTSAEHIMAAVPADLERLREIAAEEGMAVEQDNRWPVWPIRRAHVEPLRREHAEPQEEDVE